MRNEAAFWADWLLSLLHRPAQRWVAWKVPAETREGLPDVWFANPGWSGWLELKYQPQWPVRAQTPIHVRVKAAQLAHLREVGISGQAAFVLLGVDREYFLLKPGLLREDIALGREELESRSALRGWRGSGDLALQNFLSTSD